MAIRKGYAGLLLGVSVAALAACSGGASDTTMDLVGKRVDNFMLTDQTGFGTRTWISHRRASGCAGLLQGRRCRIRARRSWRSPN